MAHFFGHSSLSLSASDACEGNQFFDLHGNSFDKKMRF